MKLILHFCEVISQKEYKEKTLVYSHNYCFFYALNLIWWSNKISSIVKAHGRKFMGFP
jgi:hypothetical protein